ncbi:GTP cyclohydrolase [Candidatus Endobugula sertula]|uniref:GTP cyclohydrolase FolE2 n=1 Tax=Candidatus Endobugula sertula TaxID=62101 RepID=A0A1D2QLT5_9GAMM|nr:GTP cyclohydrolase [Candidatus Endobugula sertula]
MNNVMTKNKKPDMPDIASTQQAQHNATLDWVGMSRIALPLTICDQDRGNYAAKTFIETYVDIFNPQVKGIHMSRLYLLLAEFTKDKVLSIDTLKTLLQEKLSSHEGISRQSCLHIEFDYLINQPALKSEYSGWKDYPILIKAQLNGDRLDIELGIKVPYSSTCPCSAALSRQLMQQEFLKDFADKSTIDKAMVEQWLRSEQGSVATPHSQRSYANVWVKLTDTASAFPMSQLINILEGALKTAVQTAVKREDEQEFARLNGANQMFCEDAARRVKSVLSQQEAYKDFWVRVEHIESLHAHDAVAVATKGVVGGYSPLLHR